MNLSPAYFQSAIAHRGLHDINEGRAENSRKAVDAAITQGYGIELDLQLSKDGQAMVFHDYDLGRLTAEKGAVAQRTAAELCEIALSDDGDGIPTFVDVLKQVAGRVPLLIELKDQDGAMGPNVGPLETAVADALSKYDGPAAVMSFNPHAVAALAELAPDVPRGLVTCGYLAEDWPTVPQATREHLVAIPDFDRTASCFISHDRTDLDRARVAEIKSDGNAVFCWTVRSPQQEAEARKVADNITFEAYLA